MTADREGDKLRRESQWTRVSERGSYMGMRALVLIYRYGGSFLVAPVLYGVVFYFFITRPATRRHSRHYLQRALAGPVGTWQIWRHHMAFGRALMHRLGAWMGRLQIRHVQFPQMDSIRGMKKQGQGVIFLGAHLGNLDMCRAMVEPGLSYRLNVVVHTRHAEKFNRLIQQLNPESQINLIQVDQITPETAMLLQTKLTGGEAVVLLADRVPAGTESRHFETEFLGGRARFPLGPFWLAILLQAPVFFMTSVEAGKGYRMVLEPLLSPAGKINRSGRAEATEQLFRRYVAQLEQLCRRYPLQWFNFYDFWLDDAGPGPSGPVTREQQQ